jgi:hypothetical protein
VWNGMIGELYNKVSEIQCEWINVKNIKNIFYTLYIIIYSQLNK